MNTSSDNSKTTITLDMIYQQKMEKLTEIRASKQRIIDRTKTLFRPTETTNHSNLLMNNFQSGFAILNGIITGLKIIKRIRNFFRH